MKREVYIDGNYFAKLVQQNKTSNVNYTLTLENINYALIPIFKDRRFKLSLKNGNKETYFLSDNIKEIDRLHGAQRFCFSIKSTINSAESLIEHKEYNVKNDLLINGENVGEILDHEITSPDNYRLTLSNNINYVFLDSLKKNEAIELSLIFNDYESHFIGKFRRQIQNNNVLNNIFDFQITSKICGNSINQPSGNIMNNNLIETSVASIVSSINTVSVDFGNSVSVFKTTMSLNEGDTVAVQVSASTTIQIGEVVEVHKVSKLNVPVDSWVVDTIEVEKFEKLIEKEKKLISLLTEKELLLKQKELKDTIAVNLGEDPSSFNPKL